MTAEQELIKKLDKPDLLVVAGSRLYGTSTPVSDYDYRGFVIPPFEYTLGLHKFEHRIIREPDTVVYSIRRFFELLMLGDPTVYEILFAPESKIVNHSVAGDMVLSNRSLFACKKFARRIGGYAQSEWRKVTGTQLVPIKRISSEDVVVEDIRRTFHPQKEDMDEIVRLLFSQHPRETRPARRKLGAKRKAQIEQYGYCTSSACHTIRLLGQLVELMETGKITFPSPNAELLLSIKTGQKRLNEVDDIYQELVSKSHCAERDTHLPDNPDVKQIRSLYNAIVADAIHSDSRMPTPRNG